MICVQTRSILQVMTGAVVYYSPGVCASGGGYQWELWRLDPLTSTAALYWTPPTGWAITCLFYSTLSGAGLTYAVLGDWLSTDRAIYAWAEGGTPTLVATYGSYQYATQAAELGDAIYLSFSATTGDPVEVVRLDPTTNTLTQVFSFLNHWSNPYQVGGIGVAGGLLYFSDSWIIWRSANGTDWEQWWVAEGFGVYTGYRNLTGFTSDPSTDTIHFGAAYGWSESDPWHVVFRLDAGASAPVEVYRQAATMAYWKGQPFAHTCWRDDGATRSGPYALGDVADGVDQPIAFAGDTGAWADLGGVDLAVANDRSVEGQGMTSTGGLLYALLMGTDGAGGYATRLASSAGSAWTTVQSHADRATSFGGPWTLGAITVSRTSWKCQEL